MHNSKNSDASQIEKTYLVGSVEDTEHFLDCCPSASTLTCTDLETYADAVIAIPCRRWGCKHCGPKKAFSLAIRCELAKPQRFITLTVDPKRWVTPRDAYDGTRRKLSDFAKLLRKELKTFEYLRVLETTKRGWPHYHFVARCPYVQQSHLSDVWASMTGAKIVDVRRIDKGVNVFKYMLKYLCKQSYVPWTSRRVSWSRDFFPKPEPKENRQNPFVNRRRNKLHPAEYLNRTYANETITQKRPGVWIIAHRCDNVHDRVPFTSPERRLP